MDTSVRSYVNTLVVPIGNDPISHPYQGRVIPLYYGTEIFGAENEIRTRDLLLGKQKLYH